MEKLTKQEEEVMQAVWRLGSCGVRDVVEALPDPRPPYTTVASVVNNLKRKGYVAQSRHGNAYVYAPAISEDDYKRRFMAGFVHNYFGNSFREMVSFFAREEQLSPDDLKAIISEIEHD